MTIIIALIVIIALFYAFDKMIGIRPAARLLLSASLSIMVLLLITFVLSGLGQGLTIVVDLFWSPLNMALTMFCINFLAIILSHYPDYFEAMLVDTSKKLDWNFKGGVVTYAYGKLDPRGEIKPYLNYFRRALGTLTYGLWIYILLVLYCNINEVGIRADLIALGITLLLLYIQYHFEVLEKKIELDENGAYNLKEYTKLKQNIKLYIVFFVLSILLTWIFIIYISKNQMSHAGIIFLILISLFQAVTFILFRVFRSKLKNINKEVDVVYPDRTTQKQILKMFLGKPLKWFGNHFNYLVAISITTTLLSALLLILTYTSHHHVNTLNPIVVFMIIVILYYHLIMVFLKYFMYSRSKKKQWLTIILLVIFSGFVIAMHFASITDNDLHQIPMVNESKNEIINQYQFIQNIDTTTDAHFIIGAYGGGLKSNLWTMLVLDKLEKADPDFLPSTLCMSGVSGGAMGIGCYTMIQYHYHDYPDSIKQEFIDEIGKANALSTDISGWLIKDLYREPFKFEYSGKDRSYDNMRTYAELIGDDELHGDSLSFREYWTKVYNKRNDQYPALIINTTPTSAAYGVACSIDSMNQFPISIDILDHGNQSLSYYGAVSTSNRFPLFSPAAYVKDKGHFVDGGYFDNSGLMYASSFYKQLKANKDFKLFPKDSVFAVNIINDQTSYILSLDSIKAIVDNLEPKVKGQSEIGSILGTMINLERFPTFVRETLKEDSIHLLTIEMPHIITLDDIKSAYNRDDLDISDFGKLIDDNNDTIINALKKWDRYDYDNWGIVEPPLARLLSKPAVQYQRAMINEHPDVIANIEKIVSKL